jgi:pimeloyl-ACP methyl ester carboxylesterase
MFSFYRISRLVILMLSSGLCLAQGLTQEPEFTITEHWFTQPVAPALADTEQFQQQWFILKPKGVQDDSPVFYVVGNENDITETRLSKLYQAYGAPQDMIFIMAEHRGYGQSITKGDQTVPEYVRVEHVVSDSHRLIQSLKKQYSGPWIAAGYSYGGGLVVNLAHEYPDDVDVILSSSGAINWPHQVPGYSRQARLNFGEDFTQKLTRHFNNLTPKKAYDENWKKRELLVAAVAGLSQRGSFQSFKAAVHKLSSLPTSEFIAELEALMPDAAKAWVEGRTPGAMSEQRAKSGRFNWYVWKYQQCTQAGHFFSGKPFNYTLEEHKADCRATFSSEPALFQSKPWDVAKMLAELTTPAVVVSAEYDPWLSVGVKPDHEFTNIDYIYEEGAFHCPDKNDPVIGKKVMARLRTHLD